MSISPQRRQEILDALRRGTVPKSSLDAFAVGLERFESHIDRELATVAAGGAVFKAIRGDYGCGKTFFSRWLGDRARKKGFATAEVQISENETPLHKLETVYRRLIERLATAESPNGAFKSIIDGWFFTLEEDVLAEGAIDPQDSDALVARTAELLELRLKGVNATAPLFSAALRAYRRAQVEGNREMADAVLAWLGGQPNISAAAKRYAGVKGDIDHFGALTLLQGLLVVLRDSGRAGLLLVLDEVETIQRVRGDMRDKSLNALRQLIDEVDSGRFPGLSLWITGTPAFFEGPQGIRRLEPLAQRLAVDFSGEARFDNPRAVQLRLLAFDRERLTKVGIRIRDIFCQGSPASERLKDRCDDRYIQDLADSVAGKLGGKVGIAPRIFLKKLVVEILDRVELNSDFDPRAHYSLTVAETEMTRTEREAAGAISVDEIELDGV